MQSIAVQALPDSLDASAPWQSILARSITGLEQLAAHLDLDLQALRELADDGGDFPLKIPLSYVERMQRGNLNDPLLLQVLARRQESEPVAGFSADPLQEQSKLQQAGVIHKYQGRVLLTLTGSCPVHCRYCFRRHFPYDSNKLSRDRLDAAVALVQNDTSIQEVILSGGEPLMMRNDRLEELLSHLENITHLRQLRIHSRFPVVVPQRIDAGLEALLGSRRLPLALVLHANHPAELDTLLSDKLKALKTTGVTLLNQSVLLKGVNDDSDTLASLSHALYACGVLPYYLHVLDPVAGAAHFHVADDEARAVHQALVTQLPGYLVPRLVRDQPGASSKVHL